MKSRDGEGWTAVKRLVGKQHSDREEFHREVGFRDVFSFCECI
jgi:hypothetical protein